MDRLRSPNSTVSRREVVGAGHGHDRGGSCTTRTSSFSRVHGSSSGFVGTGVKVAPCAGRIPLGDQAFYLGEVVQIVAGIEAIRCRTLSLPRSEWMPKRSSFSSSRPRTNCSSAARKGVKSARDAAASRVA